MSIILELILCGCIALIINGSRIGVQFSMADGTMAEDKSIELLQQHLCRDECYKKVRNLCPSEPPEPGEPIKLYRTENTFDCALFFSHPIRMPVNDVAAHLPSL